MAYHAHAHMRSGESMVLGAAARPSPCLPPALAHLHGGERAVEDACQAEAGQDEELVLEGVVLPVVRDTDYFMEAHPVDDGEAGRQEDELHDRVISAAGATG